MNPNDRTTGSVGGGGTATVTRTRWGRRSPGGAFWLALLLVPLLLAALATCTGKGGIQDDLTTRSMAALKGKGITGADVSFSGRDGTLTLPGGADAAAAKEVVAGVEGVRTVSVAGGSGGGTPAEEPEASDVHSPYSITGAKGAITVEAVVGSDADKKSLLDAVAEQAGDQDVMDKVTVEMGVKPLDPAAFGTLAGAVGGYPGAKAAFDGTKTTLTGQVSTEAVKADLGAKADAVGSGEVDNQLTVAAGQGDGAGDDAVCARLDTALAAVQKRTKIQFAESSPELTSESQTAIDEIAALLEKCTDARVEVGGHTDNQGDPATSKPLSQDRAKAVRQALIEAGIAGERISARGYGETEPIASNDTAEGRAANRRVDIRIQ